MDRSRLWGAGLVAVCVFKLVTTPLVGVHPDPIHLTVTLIALALGALLMVWSLANRVPRGNARTHSHSTDRGESQ